MAITNPEKIGRYQILDRVGRGGMGVLYRGVDAVLDREVAIKLMLVDFSEDAEQMRPRFYREARAAAKLQHPNIVTVFEFAEEDNTPYIVMEFLRGTSLADRMNSPVPLTLVQKVNIVAQLCSALHYAHEQGVVHRDIKPANIFILNDGSVKLLDFGIAKVTSSTLTREGDVLGSAAYMSPEQVSGSESVDGRSDIFSVGVMLYELLAGRKPFHAEQPTAIIMKILQEQPSPLAELVPGLPAQLVAVVNRALAKDPAQRFATAGEFAKELQWIGRALQAAAESDDALDETRFASPDEIERFQSALEQVRTSSPAAGTAPVEVPSAVAPPRRWMIPAGIAAVAVAGIVIAVLGAQPSSWNPWSPAQEEPAVPVEVVAQVEAAPVEFSLQVESTPPGAAVVIDGRDTSMTTPASIVVSGEGPHKLELSLRGHVSHEAELSGADLERGSVSFALQAVETPVMAVSVSSTYPVEVLAGGRSLSAASESHQLRVQSGTTLRIRSPEYLLDATVRVDGRPVSYQAPAIGYVTVLTRHETCTVRIGARDMGYPPLTRLPIAAGQHRVDIVCPDGQNPQGQLVTVTPNTTSTVRIF